MNLVQRRSLGSWWSVGFVKKKMKRRTWRSLVLAVAAWRNYMEKIKSSMYYPSHYFDADQEIHSSERSACGPRDGSTFT
ncbi:uncharacterized protein LOC109822986 isoform X2 [Asparagus officinalis]|uniref:uncharacterized protein LOC109822986 isoform X2 n=1 Tax=Asparagus officinalis TaxID=4686 RepID=UPI00098E348C|nr:uncharacterized protein LOC109822986 isoform X2 [Asparagus officinalis]